MSRHYGSNGHRARLPGRRADESLYRGFGVSSKSVEIIVNNADEDNKDGGILGVNEAANFKRPLADAKTSAWPSLDTKAAHIGLAWNIVQAIGPETEADPIAILLQFLAAFGNAVGRGPYYQVEGDQHYANLFQLLVGTSAKGRKGTSWGRVRQIMSIAENVGRRLAVKVD
jgi:hypothetical protein